jgi:hypothetical protein
VDEPLGGLVPRKERETARNPGGPGYVGLNEDVKDSAIRILVWGLIQEGKEGFEPGSIDV